MLEVYLLYKIVSKEGREYVGVTGRTFHQRMQEHATNSSNSSLREDVSKYGWESFSKEVLCKGTKEYILYLENQFLSKYLYSTRMYNKNTGGSLNGGTFGENHGIAKLTDNIIREIRQKYSETNNLSYSKLAQEYGVTESTIGKIVRHELWAHVPDVPYKGTQSARKNKPRDSITFSDAELIREMYRTGRYSYQNISDLLDNVISKTAVGKIVRNERWK